MLYNSGPSVEDGGSSVRGAGQGNVASTTGLVLPTTTPDANCSGAGSSFLNPQQYPTSYSSSLGGVGATSGGLGSSSASASSSAAQHRAQHALGQYCQPGTHQQHYPAGQGLQTQGYQPQPHVTVSYAGAYSPSVGVGGGVGEGPLHPAQNPHWTHRHGHHHHPSSAAASAKQHHSWMANYHGFVTPIRSVLTRCLCSYLLHKVVSPKA